MISRALLLFGIVSLIFVGGCVSTSRVADKTDFGECKYSTRITGKETNAVIYACPPTNTSIQKKSERNSVFTMICNSSGSWVILLGIQNNGPSSAVAQVGYSFDDRPIEKETWGRISIVSLANYEEKQPPQKIIDGMKTAKKLTFFMDGATATIDLNGAGEGVKLFERKCKSLTKTVT